jgi:putative peptidoglycan lipid II flippase
VGTTLGIAALVVVALVPTWRLHLRLRPALRFPPGVARRTVGLAAVGVIELIAIDLANLLVIALANGRGATGAVVIFNYSPAGVQFSVRSAGTVDHYQCVPRPVCPRRA